MLEKKLIVSMSVYFLIATLALSIETSQAMENKTQRDSTPTSMMPRIPMLRIRKNEDLTSVKNNNMEVENKPQIKIIMGGMKRALTNNNNNLNANNGYDVDFLSLPDEVILTILKEKGIARITGTVCTKFEKLRQGIGVSLYCHLKNFSSFDSYVKNISQYKLNKLIISFKISPEQMEIIIAPALKELKALTHLVLSNNAMGPEGAKSLAPALKELKTLTHLVLANNAMGPEGAKSLAEALKELKALTYLVLENNAMGPEGAKSLAEALKELKALTYLGLANNNIGDFGFGYVLCAVEQLEKLQQVDLRGNHVTEVTRAYNLRVLT